jgi:cobalt/nickel transport system permease protein
VRHAAGKIVAALTLLVCIATLTAHTLSCCAAYLLLLAAAVALAKLPVGRILLGAAAVLPFALCFAAVSAVSGQPDRAAMLIVRGYLSSLTALLLIATTPMPDLLAGLELLRAPRFLLQVMQFLYRYLIVLIEEASAMRDAAGSRAGNVRSLALRQAAGAAGVLFVRSYRRAEAIHRAMMARGFEGHIPVFRALPFRTADTVLTVLAAAIAIGFRAALS